MNREELMTLLPHRDGMLLLDTFGETSGFCRATSRMPPWSPA